MGHQKDIELQEGGCQLVRCTCGRSALRVGDKVLLLSSRNVTDLGRIFRSLPPERSVEGSLKEALARLTGDKNWGDFTPPC